MYIQKEKDIKKIIFIIFMCILTQVSISQERKNKKNIGRDVIRDLPKEIKTVFGNDIIPDEETALQYSDLIFKNRYVNVPFDDMKPYIINLIGNEKVWEVKVQIGNNKNKFYILRINKNTGEILNIWLEGKGDLTRG